MVRLSPIDKERLPNMSIDILLNNDTIVGPNILTSFIQATLKYGVDQIFGPKIYYLKYPDKIWYAAGKVELKKGKIYHIGIRDYKKEKISLVIIYSSLIKIKISKCKK